MKYALQMFWENSKGEIEPFLRPIALPFKSANEARSLFGGFVEQATQVPMHSVTLTAEDGSMAERWFQIDGQWRRKDA
jgi:hypothetical protein